MSSEEIQKTQDMKKLRLEILSLKGDKDSLKKDLEALCDIATKFIKDL